MPHRYPLALLLAVLLATGPARAQEVPLNDQVAAAAALATDIYALIDGVRGEATARGYEGWVDVLAYSHALSNSVTVGPIGGGGGAGKSQHSPVSISKYLDASSNPLVQAVNTGRHIKTVTFDFVSGGARPFVFFKVELTDVIVNSYAMGAASGGDRPVEGVSFVYAKVKSTYCQQTATGAPGPCSTSSWDVTTNTGQMAAALSGPVAAVSGAGASLSWAMAEQDGVAGFEVQRWEDGAFRRAAYVPGAGWTAEEAEYSAAVAGLERGVHLFRLAVLGVDGQTAYSEGVRVAVGVADGEGLVVGAPFPNPFAQGTALPIASGTVQHARVTVLDVLGREVAVLFDGAVQPGAETLVPFAAGADLPAGLYVLRVVSESGATSRTVTLRR